MSRDALSVKSSWLCAIAFLIIVVSIVQQCVGLQAAYSDLGKVCSGAYLNDEQRQEQLKKHNYDVEGWRLLTT